MCRDLEWFVDARLDRRGKLHPLRCRAPGFGSPSTFSPDPSRALCRVPAPLRSMVRPAHVAYSFLDLQLASLSGAVLDSRDSSSWPEIPERPERPRLWISGSLDLALSVARSRPLAVLASPCPVDPLSRTRRRFFFCLSACLVLSFPSCSYSRRSCSTNTLAPPHVLRSG